MTTAENVLEVPDNTLVTETTPDTPPTSVPAAEPTPKLSEIIESTKVIPEDGTRSSSVGTNLALKAVIFENRVSVEVEPGVTKVLDINDFVSLMVKTTNSIREEAPVFGILPPSNMFFFSATKTEMRLSCYYPSGIKPLKYSDSGERVQDMQIMTPNIIISHVLYKDGKDWINKSTNYFCTDLPISKLPKTFIGDLNARARIYLLPMSNTYDNANMCYGNNSMPSRHKDDNLRGLDYYYSFLWDTPFNNDLGIRATGSSDVRGWYKYLAELATKNEPFPYSKLRHYSTPT